MSTLHLTKPEPDEKRAALLSQRIILGMREFSPQMRLWMYLAVTEAYFPSEVGRVRAMIAEVEAMPI